MYTHRIRRCNGNKDAWMLVSLNKQGEEMLTHGAYTTALSLDGIIRFCRETDVVQIVYYTKEDAK